MCCVYLPKPHHLSPDEKGAPRHGETGGVCCRHGNPPFPHIRQLSDIIWLAVPGLWKEAHTVLSERQQQQERDRATRGEPVKEGGRFFFFFFKSAGARETDREGERGQEEEEKEGQDEMLTVS